MKTVLFDLDGTLLHVDIEAFLKEYLQAISNYCRSLAEPQVFTQRLLESTHRMVQNDGSRTNEEVFMQSFLPAIGKRKEEVYPVLENFYTQEFPLLERYVKRADEARLVAEEVLSRGWQIILATNPLFPRKAIMERMRWAGIDQLPWLHVTSYENSKSSKPSLLYYQQILQGHGLHPEDCWMIGNDTGEDLVASQLGLKTYLVTDYLIERENASFVPQGRGSLSDLLEFVRKEL
ncbi:MAG: HAD family hydrolase [Clostridia bacterium]|jgi:FMN phosphatase YigB (HAD superfamily)|nr:HAD family hydrolase [Clostridia bacterium]